MRLTVYGPGHPFRGGIARTTTSLVEALAARGHELRFVTPWRQYPSWLYPGSDDRDPAACAELPFAERVLDPLNPLSWPASRRLALARSADAWVIPYWTWAWAGLWRTLLGTRGRPPVAAVVHNPQDHDATWLQRWATRRVLGRCDGLFTHSASLAGGLRRRFPRLPVASHPLAVRVAGPLPPRNEARQSCGVAAGERLALFFGLIRPYKGVDLLLEAFARLPESSPWRLLVAGEVWGDAGDTLRRQAAHPAAAGRVRLELGWVSEPRMAELLAAADLVVLPYRSGSQSAVAPEALARGVPVLSTRVGGLPEVVRDNVNGRLVEANSVEAIAAALGAFDDRTLARLATGARASAAELSWARYAAAFEGLLLRVTRGHTG